MGNVTNYTLRPVDREAHLRSQRDLARNAAVALEGLVAAARFLHRPVRYCQAHGVKDHACGGRSLFRCFECAAEYADRPCRTWLALEGEWTP